MTLKGSIYFQKFPTFSIADNPKDQTALVATSGAATATVADDRGGGILVSSSSPVSRSTKPPL